MIAGYNLHQTKTYDLEIQFDAFLEMCEQIITAPGLFLERYAELNIKH